MKKYIKKNNAQNVYILKTNKKYNKRNSIKNNTNKKITKNQNKTSCYIEK